MKAVASAAPLKKPHYQFPRGRTLREVLTSCMTGHYTKAVLGGGLEARGIGCLAHSIINAEALPANILQGPLSGPFLLAM